MCLVWRIRSNVRGNCLPIPAVGQRYDWQCGGYWRSGEVDSASTMKNKIHIVPHEGEWAVRVSGVEEAVATEATQRAAIELAMGVAADRELDVVVHRRDGSFRNFIQSLRDLRACCGLTTSSDQLPLAAGAILGRCCCGLTTSSDQLPFSGINFHRSISCGLTTSSDQLP